MKLFHIPNVILSTFLKWWINMLIIKAEYLGSTNIGVKVHSKFLASCDPKITFESLKKEAISKDNAPFFIDLYDQEESTIIDSIGISESAYGKLTGEVIMSYEYYQREADFNQDLVFGAIEENLRAKGVDMPWSEKESLGLSAQKLKKFRQSDHEIIEMNVDDLELASSTNND